VPSSGNYCLSIKESIGKERASWESAEVVASAGEVLRSARAMNQHIEVHCIE
jgi:hypothetical protein